MYVMNSYEHMWEQITSGMTLQVKQRTKQACNLTCMHKFITAWSGILRKVLLGLGLINDVCPGRV